MENNKCLSYQEQYANILKELINLPDKIVKYRNGFANSSFFKNIKIDLTKEFPLMEIKKIDPYKVLGELIWFLNGDTNITYLRKNSIKIWDDDAYRYYNEKIVDKFHYDKISKETFLNNVDNKKLVNKNVFGKYYYGELDNIYGYNWRCFGGLTDQIKTCYEMLRDDPNSRRILVIAHNPNDIEDNIVGLPACHNYFQFYTTPIVDNHIGDEKYYLSLHFNMRSNDMFLGNPYNITSYSILLHLFAKALNMIPKYLSETIIDTHLYSEHINPAIEWLDRYKQTENSYCSSELEILLKKDEIIKGLINYPTKFTFDDFKFKNYNPNKTISAKLLT